MRNLFNCIFFFAFWGMVIINLNAVYTFFADYLRWWAIFAIPLTLIAVSIPIVNATLAIIASHFIWRWDLSSGFLVFLLPEILMFLSFFLLSVYESLGSKITKQKDQFLLLDKKNEIKEVEKKKKLKLRFESVDDALNYVIKFMECTYRDGGCYPAKIHSIEVDQGEKIYFLSIPTKNEGLIIKKAKKHSICEDELHANEMVLVYLGVSTHQSEPVSVLYRISPIYDVEDKTWEKIAS